MNRPRRHEGTKSSCTRHASCLRAFVAYMAMSVGIVRGDAAMLATTSIPIGIEGRTNAAPSIAAHRDLVAVAWAATRSGVTDVYTATSTDGGRTFARPVRVNDAAGAASVSGEQP